MASFTDTVPQFNPYVEQLPIEAMVKVGTYKQEKYDQGIQKIQGYIDNIAGLDISKDIHKEYLQSKLNELGNNLTKVAAGDFSNFQLVNSVSGMANQVIKDPIIQNAVSSTAFLKKEKESQRTLQKEGKSGASNDWKFNKDVNSWLNDGKLETSFSTPYKPYTNWKKNSLEVIKGLTGDSSITDDAFTTITDPKTGKPQIVIADAIVRKKLAGISPEKIQQALMVGLTPDDFQQMETDGRYNYSNSSDEAFSKALSSSYTDKVKFFMDQKTVLENAKFSTSSTVEKTKLEDQIASMDKTIKGLQDEYKSITSTFANGDVESAKAKLFTIDSMNGFSKAFAHTEISQTYENSPLLQAQQFRETKEQTWTTFMLTYTQNEKFHNDDLESKRLDRNEKKRENDLKQKELEGYGGLPKPVDKNLLPTYDYGKIVDEADKGYNALKTSDLAFSKSIGKDEGWLDQQKEAWEKSPNSVDSRVADYFMKTEVARRRVDSDQRMVLDIDNAAKEKFGTIDDLIPKDAPSLDYSSASGKYRYTPKDFVNFNSLLDKYVTTTVSGGTGGAAVSVRYDDVAAKKELSDKMYNLYQLYKTDPSKLGAGGKTLMNSVRHYAQTVNFPFKETVKQITEFKRTELNNRITAMQGVGYSIPTATPAQKTTIASALVNFADFADQQTGGLANSPNWDSKIARKLALDPESKYTFDVIEGTERDPAMYMAHVTGNAGTIDFRVTPEQKAAVFGSMFEPSLGAQFFRPYQEALRKNGGMSTAPYPTQPTTSKNAYLSSVDFPNVQIYGVKANVIQASAGRYTLRLAVYDPVEKKWYNDIQYPRKGLLNDEQGGKAIVQLNDAAIHELIYEKPMTSADAKKLQNASQKPL